MTMDFHTFALVHLFAFFFGFVSGSLMVAFSNWPKNPEDNKDLKALTKSIEGTNEKDA